MSINVLSLFDGMSCGQIALERAGIPVKWYLASEIDKYAISVTQANYPRTIQLGDITKLDIDLLPKIDLLIGGSPCQGFSFAGKQLAFNDPRSALFFEYVKILQKLRERNPDIKFLLENVRMKQEYLDVISSYLGVWPICINSALVSAQSRVRYYWTNIPGVDQPEDRGIVLRDILETEGKFVRRTRKGGLKKGIDKAGCLTGGGNSGGNHSDMDILDFHETEKLHVIRNGNEIQERGDKSHYIDANYHKGIDRHRARSAIGTGNGGYRALTPVECERLQTVPDGYTGAVSNTQRYKMLGNGWTVEVIAHILRATRGKIE